MAIWSKRSLRVRRASTRPLVPLAASIRIEQLEERTLLSAVLPGLNDHGLYIGNGQAAGKASVLVDSTENSKLSNNASGSGLVINLNNKTGKIDSLKNIVIRNVRVLNNGNAGVQIRLTNLKLDNLTIDKSVISGSGGAGLYLNFTNVTIKTITIVDSNNPSDPDIPNLGSTRFTANAFDGVHVLGKNSNISNLRVLGTVARGNAGHGMLFDLDNVRVTSLSFNDNEAVGNTNGSGIHFATNRAVIGTGSATLVNNTATGNSSHGLSFVSQSLLPGSVPTLSPTKIKFANIADNNFSTNLGSGVSVDLREQAAWDAKLLRNTIGGNQLRGFDLKAIDTESAFDLQIGSTAVNPQQQLIDGNFFDANVGAAIAIELNDSTGALNNTTGRFRILGNTITNSVAAAGSSIYLGQGVHISARGDVTRQNGAARYFQSTIDKNIITGNAGDGVLLNITEDSELIDLTIGNLTGRNQTFDVNGVAAGGGNVPTVAGDGNTIEGNGGNGISLYRRSSAYIKNVRILDNLITTNAGEGIYLQASNTYETVPNSPRPSLAIVTDITIERNSIEGNGLNGVHARSEHDAVLLVNLRYNRIDANILNGIRITGLENNIADFENVGGTWIKNAITNNGVGLDAAQVANGHGNGIRIEGVVGSVNPLIIGRDGSDAGDNQSLGNFIAGNGEDGIEIGARPGDAGTVTPRDIRDAVEIVNNNIINNGKNAIGSPYLAGKGIDIELVASVVLNRSGQTREFRIDRNIIQGNAGDGIELNNRGGQLRLSAQGNFIDLNGGRGVDLLNQAASSGTDAEAYVRFGGPDDVDRNIITNNGLEGFYVVNTPAPGQTQDVNAEDPMVTWDISGSRLEAITTVNMILDFENNEVRDNGGGVPLLNNSPPSTFSGTGLVIRVGSQYSAGDWDTIADLTGYADYFSTAAAGGVGTNGFDSGGSVERDYRVSGNGRVNARIVDNEFSGNGGDDVALEGYAALIPRTTNGTWSATEFARGTTVYDRDPLSRLNLEFLGNTGDSLDVVRTQSGVDGEIGSYTNAEGDWKSRTSGRTAPDPNGPFGSQAGRNRLVTRVADRGAGGGSLADAYNPDFRLGFSGVADFFTSPTNGPNVNSLGSSIDIAEVDGLVPGAPIVVTVASRSDTISEATNANPSVITSAGHGLFTGDQITISGATGNTAINGTWNVQRLSFDTFQLRDPVTNALVAGNGAYNAGSATWTLLGQHNLSTGDLVTISGTGVPNADGVHMVRVLDDASFELYVPTDIFNFFGGTLVPVPGQGFSTSGAGTVVQHNPGKFQFDGLGPSTLRIESNWSTIGFSDLEQGDNFNEVWSEGTSPAGVGWNGVATNTFSFLTAEIADVTVNETAGTASLTVTLSEAAPPEGVLIYYHTTDGSAFADPNNDGNPADGDYTPVSQDGFTAVFIAGGQTSTTIDIDILNDSAFDGVEQFYVDLYQITDGDFVDSRGIVTINPDADAIPVISVDDVFVDEVTGKGVVKVRLSNASSDVVSVDYTTVNGIALAGVDYADRSGTITFAPGEVEQTVEITLVTDGIAETDETFRIDLSSPDKATLLDASGTVSIRDTRYFSVTDVQVVEGGQATVTVSLNEPLPAGVIAEVDFMLQGGTATFGNDFLFTQSGTLTFVGGGPTTQTLVISTANEGGLAEGDETFTVELSNATNAAIAKASGTVTIIDAFQAESTDEFDHEIGTAEVDGWSSTGSVGTRGYLLHGKPKLSIQAGLQTAIFRLLVPNPTAANHAIVRIDVYNGNTGQILAQRLIRRHDFIAANAYTDFALTFDNPIGSALEFRVEYLGVGYVKVDSVRVSTARTPARVLEAESDLSHTTGRSDPGSWVAIPRVHNAGYLSAGPGMSDLPAGSQSATFRLRTRGPAAANDVLATISVYDSKSRRNIAQLTIRKADFVAQNQWQEFVLDFQSAPGQSLQFRTHWTDKAIVWVDRVIVTENPAGPLQNFESESEDFSHNVGRLSADGWSADPTLDTAGWMSYGPGTTEVPGGTHAAVFRLLIDDVDAADTNVVRIEVFSEGSMLAQRILRRSDFDADFQYQEFALSFTNSTGASLQFRAFWYGTVFVQQDLVAVVDVPAPQLHLEAEGGLVSHQVGSDDGNGGWSATVGVDTPGTLVEGTGTTVLPNGSYTANFRLKIDALASPATQVASIMVVDVLTGQVLARQVLTRGMFNQADVYQNFALTFTTQSTRTLTFRTDWLNKTNAAQDYVNVLPSNFDDSELDVVFEGVDELLLVS